MAKPIIINEMDMQNKEIITISSNNEMSQFVSKLRHNKSFNYAGFSNLPDSQKRRFALLFRAR